MIGIATSSHTYVAFNACWQITHSEAIVVRCAEGEHTPETYGLFACGQHKGVPNGSVKCTACFSPVWSGHQTADYSLSLWHGPRSARGLSVLLPRTTSEDYLWFILRRFRRSSSGKTFSDSAWRGSVQQLGAQLAWGNITNYATACTTASLGQPLQTANYVEIRKA